MVAEDFHCKPHSPASLLPLTFRVPVEVAEGEALVPVAAAAAAATTSASTVARVAREMAGRPAVRWSEELAEDLRLAVPVAAFSDRPLGLRAQVEAVEAVGLFL